MPIVPIVPIVPIEPIEPIELFVPAKRISKLPRNANPTKFNGAIQCSQYNNSIIWGSHEGDRRGDMACILERRGHISANPEPRECVISTEVLDYNKLYIYEKRVERR